MQPDLIEPNLKPILTNTKGPSPLVVHHDRLIEELAIDGDAQPLHRVAAQGPPGEGQSMITQMT